MREATRYASILCIYEFEALDSHLICWPSCSKEKEDEAYAMALSEQLNQETTRAPVKGSTPIKLSSPPPAKPVKPAKAVPSSSSKPPASKSAVVYGQALPSSFSPASIGVAAAANPLPAPSPFMSGTDRPSPGEEAKVGLWR